MQAYRAGERSLALALAEALCQLEPLLAQAKEEMAQHAEALGLLKLARQLWHKNYAMQTRQAIEVA